MIRFALFPRRHDTAAPAAALIAATLCALATSPGAQTVLSTTDAVVQGKLCVGVPCGTTQGFLTETLLLRGTDTAIRFDDVSSDGGPTNDWQILANDVGNSAAAINRFSIMNRSENTTPFTIEGPAPVNSLYVAGNGDVGLGASLPQDDLHLQGGSTSSLRMGIAGSDGSAAFRLSANAFGLNFQATGRNVTNPTFRSLLTILSSADHGVVQISNDDLILTGDLTIEGDLFTHGSVCAAGCDRVFDADYPLPTIAEQAAQMRSARHLPNVGPTDEDGPFNVTQKVGGMLNELEKAQDRDNQARTVEIAKLRTRLAGLADLDARLTSLESAPP
ncbi:hypothetical protein [Puniceibacterium sp. IMCC21224]|uniref:hypothetical protein n=1 Tax=Puniceibacterium sp. IMCC21224 TaxID=1618204 RepID=UPI00065D6209|nr:hypothetical protein [Puniceibacterium sp. IMCC21224]KMK63999.1 hypothetical protein IMCC21224_1657 [Puniceibacterium sp. IMCC21224]